MQVGKLGVPPSKRPRDSVRAKLLRVMMGIWVLVSVAILVAVGISQWRASLEAGHLVEQLVREDQREKAKLLIVNQVRALRGLAADNSFSDVRELVAQTVNDDVDVIYGLYTDASGAVWVLVTPATPSEGVSGPEAVKWANDVPSDVARSRAPGARVREASAFGGRVEEHAADVFDGSEYLGTVRYGTSLSRTESLVRQQTERARRVLLQVLGLLAVLGAVGVLLGVAAIRRVANRITQPLSELARVAQQLGEGERDVRVAIASGDEIEQLAQTFNEMADANQRTMQALEVKTAEALESSRLKSEFLANMSHEIRTPMNGILGVVRLARRFANTDQLRRYIETIDSSAAALLTIVNDVLDFSKMEAGKYELRRSAFDLRTIVQDVCELLAARAHDRGLVLVCSIDPRLRLLHYGDPDRIRQVVNNLLGNAIKFTERGEVIVAVRLVASDELRERLSISVIDTGIGIAEENIPKLFGAFSQVDGSSMRRYGGTGLGLVISKRLVELMGGTISVRSVLGKGSEFCCELTLETAEARSSERGPWTEGKRAWLIEENERWREVIREHLQVWGIDVVCLANTREALTRIHEAKSAPFDMAIVAMEAERANVERFLRDVRGSDWGSRLPMVGLYVPGAGTIGTEIEQLLSAQLPKPLRVSVLYNALIDNQLGERPASGKHRTSGNLPVVGGGRVLVVDDSDVNRFVAAEMLEQLGYEVELAENGLEAVQKIQRIEYAAVLMDCQMPVMDGYSAAREIRQAEAGTGRHQTIIALTAHALSGERDRVLEAGMDDYLTKPVRIETLGKSMRRHARVKDAPSVGSEQGATGAVEPVSVEPCLDDSIVRSKRLVELFVNNMSKQLDEIELAVKSGDASALRAVAHKSKGTCGAFGAMPMARTAEALQQQAETGATEAGAPLVRKLRGQFDAVLKALQRDAGAR